VRALTGPGSGARGRRLPRQRRSSGRVRQARDDPGARGDAGERKRDALAEELSLVGEHGVDMRLRWGREVAISARLDEEEVHVGGAHAPSELERGALGEVGDGVALEDGNFGEARARVARALDEDAARRRAGRGRAGGGGREAGGRGHGCSERCTPPRGSRGGLAGASRGTCGCLAGALRRVSRVLAGACGSERVSPRGAREFRVGRGSRREARAAESSGAEAGDFRDMRGYARASGAGREAPLSGAREKLCRPRRATSRAGSDGGPGAARESAARARVGLA